MYPPPFAISACFASSSCSRSWAIFHSSLAFWACFISPLSPANIPILTPAKINNTTIVTTNATKVTPFLFLLIPVQKFISCISLFFSFNWHPPFLFLMFPCFNFFILFCS